MITVSAVGKPCALCEIPIKFGETIYYGLKHKQVTHKKCYERYQNQLTFKAESEQLQGLKTAGWIKPDMTIEDLKKKPTFDPLFGGRK